MKCPKCGGKLQEQPKFSGCFDCANLTCGHVILTPVGVANLQEAIREVKKSEENGERSMAE